MASAILAALSFPPADLHFLAWIAWVPLLLALLHATDLASAALAGATHFACLHLLTCSWFLSVLRIHGGVELPVAWATLGASAVLFMPWGAAAGAAVAFAAGRRGVPGLLAACVAWPALDALRCRFPLGFPWWLPGMTQAGRPDVLGVAELGGVHAVSALVLLVDVGVAATLVALARGAVARRAGLTLPPRAGSRASALLEGPRRPAVVSAVVALMLAAAGLLHGVLSARLHRPAPGAVRPELVGWAAESAKGGAADSGAEGRQASGSATRAGARSGAGMRSEPPPRDEPDAGAGAGSRALRVALVQGSVPQAVVLSPDPREDVERATRQLELTRRALSAGAELVAWSESAHPGSAGQHPWILRALSRDLGLADRAGGSPAGQPHEAIVGLIVEARAPDGSAGIANAAVVVDAQGLLDRYDKVVLVPFGEYLPAPRVFFWVRALAAGVGEMVPGLEPRPVAGSRGLMGVSICYEAVLPQHSRELVRRGARLVVNLTNDGWFRGTPAPEQHLRFSALRAVETRRWVARCANSGITALVAPDGSIAARLEEGRRGVLLGDVVLKDGATPYVLFGDAPLLAALLLVAAWVVGPGGLRSPGGGSSLADRTGAEGSGGHGPMGSEPEEPRGGRWT